jgi:ceramide glucosyltransferase
VIFFFWACLVIALVGTASSSIFLGLTLAGAWYHTRQRPRNLPQDSPPVSVLKPMHGLEPDVRENIESFFRQDYPVYEVLFAVAGEDDAALPVIREVCARYPQVSSTVVVTGPPQIPNPPSHAFHCMSQICKYDILVTSDSDVQVGPTYLRDVVAPFSDPRTGMVTCVYRGKNLGGFWSALDAVGMSVEMTAGVLVANMLEGMKFGLGPTIAVRKEALERIGGYTRVGQYFSNDFVIGSFIADSGYKVVLSHHVIDHVVAPMNFRDMWNRQLRWAQGTRYSRPWGHVGSGLVFAMPYGILGLIAALSLGHAHLGVALFTAALLNRLLECWAVGWKVVHDPAAKRSIWLYPLRDISGFVMWCASYLTRQVMWRNNLYEFGEGGKIVLRQMNKKS